MAEYTVGSEGGAARAEGFGRKLGERMKTGKHPPHMLEDGWYPAVGEKQM